MSTPLEELNRQVNAFMDDVDQRFLDFLDRCDTPGLDRATVAASLKDLTARFGTADYGFNLAIERYVERFCELIRDELPHILADHSPKHAALARISEDTGIAFAAYYALSLIYKKENSEEALCLLKELVSDKYRFFTRLYPLAFEVRSRYHKRAHEYETALEDDEQAINYLWQMHGIRNYALCISYASTVCRMLDKGYMVDPHQRSDAEQYIQAAIAYNPTYPKYHFLHAKLLFHIAAATQDPADVTPLYQEALSSIKKAIALQMAQPGEHYEKELREYNSLKNKIQQEQMRRKEQSLPFRHLGQQEMQEFIRKIKNSSESKECIPPNPNLKPGQKYFFISYSHQDFKSVYCDLLYLYSHKIPFQFDGPFHAGIHWVEKVLDLIQHEDCVGVIFFLSRSTLLSEAVERECRLLSDTLQGRKPYFTVNLEGSMRPSHILMQTIVEHTIPNCLQDNVDHERMIRYLTTFHDDITFVPKLPEDGPDGTKHMNALKAAIRQVFPQLGASETPHSVAGV